MPLKMNFDLSRSGQSIQGKKAFICPDFPLKKTDRISPAG